MRRSGYALALSLCFFACSSPPASGVHTLVRGGAQKGPFVEGSQINIASIDGTGSPTGFVYPTETVDDRGTFIIPGSLSQASIEANGYYYDEISGEISDAPLTLRAFVDFGQTTMPIVNVVTHLAYRRAMTLMQEGMSLSAAESQAEGELVRALGIGGADFALSAAGASLDLFGGNTSANAYLFALSAIFVQAARDRPGAGSVSGDLQEMLDHASVELSANGELSAATLAPLRTAESELDPWLTLENLATRMSLLGIVSALPDINAILDTDHDGYTNANDNCPLVANPSQHPVTNAVCKRRHLSTSVTGPNAWPSAPSGIAVGDFNEDGHLDVILSGTDTNGFYPQYGFFAGDGAYFHPSPISQVLPAGATMKALDVNMDHHLDLVTLGNGEGYFPGTGTGDFGAFVSVEMTFPASGDFNADGAPDFLTACGNTLCELVNDGSGHFTSSSLPTSPFPFYAPMGSPVVGDVNNDGAQDIIATSYASYGFAVYLGNGHGMFTVEPLQQATPTASVSDAIADINHDGYGDLVAALNNVTLAVSFSAGDGTFGPYHILANNSAENDVAVADITADGVPDVVYRAATDSFEGMARSIMYVPGGGPSFPAPADLNLSLDPNGTTPIVPADVNGDGRLDLVVPNVNLTNDQLTIDVLLLNF